jgi:anti-anti-sigma factor
VPETITTSTNGRGVLRVTNGAGDAGPVTEVALSGELDLATLPELQRALGKADPDSGPVVLALREVDFMDCAGAHLLCDSDRRLREKGRSLSVIVDRGPIDRLLALLGLSDQLLLHKQPPHAQPSERPGSNGAPGLQSARSGHEVGNAPSRSRRAATARRDTRRPPPTAMATPIQPRVGRHPPTHPRRWRPGARPPARPWPSAWRGYRMVRAADSRSEGPGCRSSPIPGRAVAACATPSSTDSG